LGGLTQWKWDFVSVLGTWDRWDRWDMGHGDVGSVSWDSGQRTVDMETWDRTWDQMRRVLSDS
jgi:hypothetical protein